MSMHFCNPRRLKPTAAHQLTSRSPKAVTTPAASASSRGFGQDTTCYGEHLGFTDGLATLLGALATGATG